MYVHTEWTHQQSLKESLFFSENFLQQKKDKRTIRREIQVNSVTKNSGYSGRHSKEVWANEKYSDKRLETLKTGEKQLLQSVLEVKECQG